jgi:hypothetical protein
MLSRPTRPISLLSIIAIEFLGHFLFPRAVATMELISTVGAVSLFLSRSFFLCRQQDSERVYDAQPEADFGSRFALLHFDNPLPADADRLGERPLVKTELDAMVPDEGSEIGRGSSAL